MKYRIRSIVRGVIDGRAMMILRPIRRARELEDCARYRRMILFLDADEPSGPQMILTLRSTVQETWRHDITFVRDDA